VRDVDKRSLPRHAVGHLLETDRWSCSPAGGFEVPYRGLNRGLILRIPRVTGSPSINQSSLIYFSANLATLQSRKKDRAGSTILSSFAACYTGEWEARDSALRDLTLEIAYCDDGRGILQEARRAREAPLPRWTQTVRNGSRNLR